MISCGTDPLTHHGRHFGRTIHAFCTISALVNNGVLRLRELAEKPEEQFTNQYVMASTHSLLLTTVDREQREQRVFNLLTQMVPGIEGRLVEGSDGDVAHIAELVSAFYVRISYAEALENWPDSERGFRCQIG